MLKINIEGDKAFELSSKLCEKGLRILKSKGADVVHVAEYKESFQFFVDQSEASSFMEFKRIDRMVSLKRSDLQKGVEKKEVKKN